MADDLGRGAVGGKKASGQYNNKPRNCSERDNIIRSISVRLILPTELVDNRDKRWWRKCQPQKHLRVVSPIQIELYMMTSSLLIA